MKTDEFEIQILEREEGDDTNLHPRLVLDDYWGNNIPTVHGRLVDKHWFMGLFDRPNNLFHHN